MQLPRGVRLNGDARRTECWNSRGSRYRLSERAARTGSVPLLFSRPWERVAKSIEITPLDPATNTIAITYSSTDRCAIVFKNLVVGVMNVTNSFDFALAILNAWLPEADRIAVLPPRLP